MMAIGATLAYVGGMFTAIDSWIGKTLFIPPIIKFCQLTRQTQYAVARMFWFVAALDGFYRAETLLWSIIWGLFSIAMMVTAVRRADMPAYSAQWFRLLGLLLLGLDLIHGVRTGEWAGIEFWVFVLLAEYAATIRTVPPVEKKGATTRAATPRI
jgi:hypothetical protein